MPMACSTLCYQMRDVRTCVRCRFLQQLIPASRKVDELEHHHYWSLRSQKPSATRAAKESTNYDGHGICNINPEDNGGALLNPRLPRTSRSHQFQGILGKLQGPQHVPSREWIPELYRSTC